MPGREIEVEYLPKGDVTAAALDEALAIESLLDAFPERVSEPVDEEPSSDEATEEEVSE